MGKLNQLPLGYVSEAVISEFTYMYMYFSVMFFCIIQNDSFELDISTATLHTMYARNFLKARASKVSNGRGRFIIIKLSIQNKVIAYF